MKILFCIYQLDYADHIAVAYLSAVARALDHATSVCVLKDQSLLDAVKSTRPDVVAYSANIHGFEEMVAAHKQARAQWPFVAIMGGPQATFSPETFPHSEVDAYCIGEGEGAFKDFLERLEQGKPYDDVLNLKTSVASNAVRPLIEDLNTLPMPDRDITMSHSFLKYTPKKTFYTTRGCPFHCHYCANSFYKRLYKGKGRVVRRFAVDRVLEEIESVKTNYRTDFIKFGDDVFALNVDLWLEEFADKYARRIKIPFNCFLRLDTVEEHLLRTLKRAGCHSVHLSVDSTSEHIREKILGRRMRKTDIAQKLRLIHDHGLKTWVNFMLAVPESTMQDDLETIALSKKGKATYSNYSTTVPMAGTVLYSYCVERGLIDPAVHVSDMRGCTQPTELRCFDQLERDVRYNIFLMGPLLAKFPFPLDWLGTKLIRTVRPNRLFSKLHSLYYEYSIENQIFNLHRKHA